MASSSIVSAQAPAHSVLGDSKAKEQVLAADPPALIPIIVGNTIPPAVVPSPPLKPFVAVYYPDYAADSLAPESLDFDRIDWVDFGTKKLLFSSYITLSHDNESFRNS
jgi:hypothetical protein